MRGQQLGLNWEGIGEKHGRGWVVWVWTLSELGLSIGMVKWWAKLVLGMFLPLSQPHKFPVLEFRGQAGPGGTEGSLG